MSRCQVFSEHADGSDRVWLDSLGLIGGLQYGSLYPGGDALATWQANLPTYFQHRSLTYGRLIGITCGGSELWHGFLDNPVRGTAWQMTAVGLASVAKQYAAIAATSGNALNLNEVVDAAITRGLPFTRPSSLPALSSTAASVPSGSLMLDAALDQVAAGQTTETYWTTDTHGVLTMGAAPTTPTYTLLAESAGGGRSLDGFATDVFVQYFSASGVQSVETRSATSRPYGRFEAVLDKTTLGLIPSSQADNLGDGFLARNAPRLRYRGSFTVTYGQLVTYNGGAPVDLATVRAGFLANVIVTDPDSAGEVGTVTIPQVLFGGCTYDVDSDTLSLTPVYQAQDSLQALLGAGDLVTV